MRLFLCGDVMCGRGIDQVLAHPCSAEIYEDYMRSAEGYVLLAEQANGPIPRRNGPSYVWGAALDQLARMEPDARIINLETAVTRSNDVAYKGINYRMSPENAACLAAAKIDCCVLANNHVLDWGRSGLRETLATLEKLNIKAAGAGRNDREARAPAVLNLDDGRLLIFSFGSTSSGVPIQWAATGDTQGSTCCLTYPRRARWRSLTKSWREGSQAISSSFRSIGDPIGDTTFRMSTRFLPGPSSTRQACRSFTGILRIIQKRSKSIEIVSFSMAAVIS
jgi:poly-gamma-glutamate capsule biosynthesis protein CapA/YwtB (metallophosphatase superfamily)